MAHPAAVEARISETALGYRPLYRQVREALVARLIDGTWTPGMLLPSEHHLASELGVSQGTVRKALDSLAADHLLVRRQGRGTFVAEPEEGRILFQFFKLTADDGSRALPETLSASLEKLRADAEARQRLALPARSSVWRIDRVRRLQGGAPLFERIILPAARFPGLDRLPAIPNNLYLLYATRFGITVGRAVERLKAVAASPADAAAIGCPEGAPLLTIDRTAFALDGTPSEWRVTRCRTDGFHYFSDLK